MAKGKKTDISSREGDNLTRRGRLAKVKKGPGVFVYDGSAVDHEWVPTPKLIGRKEPKFGADGLPLMDAAGRQVYERAGRVATDDAGRVVMGGVPKVVTKAVKTFVIRGKSFPAGEPVEVKDQALALKLRCLECFDEVDGDGAVVADEPKPKRGRAKKAAESEELPQE